MSTITRVAVLTIGGLLSFTGAADAHRHGRHAMTRHEYSGFERRGDWQALNWDRARFDRSGTLGRMGLGADPVHPEGPGDVSD